jgi:hypothetical protein
MTSCRQICKEEARRSVINLRLGTALQIKIVRMCEIKEATLVQDLAVKFSGKQGTLQTLEIGPLRVCFFGILVAYNISN